MARRFFNDLLSPVADQWVVTSTPNTSPNMPLPPVITARMFRNSQSNQTTSNTQPALASSHLNTAPTLSGSNTQPVPTTSTASPTASDSRQTPFFRPGRTSFPSIPIESLFQFFPPPLTTVQNERTKKSPKKNLTTKPIPYGKH